MQTITNKTRKSHGKTTLFLLWMFRRRSEKLGAKGFPEIFACAIHYKFDLA